RTFNLAWINGDRWSLSLDLTSREEGSALPREEMMAEAEFRITPRISVGGELTIGAEEFDDTAQWEDQEIEAGIRLRSAFKF
ncbi:MAG: NtrZ family periplasmic regulatory protein, partial [Pseudomonadota bacterium]